MDSSQNNIKTEICAALSALACAVALIIPYSYGNDTLLGLIPYAFVPILLVCLAVRAAGGAALTLPAGLALLFAGLTSARAVGLGAEAAAESLRTWLPALVFAVGHGYFTRRQSLSVAAMAVGAVGASLVLAMLAYGNEYSVFGVPAVYAPSRVGGFFLYPNTFAGASSACGALILAAWVMTNSRVPAWLAGLVGGLLFGGCAYAGSRGAIIAAIVGVLALVASCGFAGRLRRLGAVGKFAVLACALLFLHAYLAAPESIPSGAAAVDRISGVASYASGTTWRAWCQGMAIQDWLVSPHSIVLGNGPQSFFDAFLLRAGDTSMISYSAHGDYSEWLCEYGLLGAFVLIALVAAYMWGLTRTEIFILVPFLAVLAVRGLADSDLHGGQTGLLLAAVALCGGRAASRARRSSSYLVAVASIALAVGSALMVSKMESYRIALRRAAVALSDGFRSDSPAAISRDLIKYGPGEMKNLDVARAILLWVYHSPHGEFTNRAARGLQPAAALATIQTANSPSPLHGGCLSAIALATLGADRPEMLDALALCYPKHREIVWARAQVDSLLGRDPSNHVREFLASGPTPQDPIDMRRRKVSEKSGAGKLGVCP